MSSRFTPMEAQLAYPGFIPAAEAPQRGAFVIRPNPRVNPAGRGAKVRRFPRTMEEASLADKYLMDVPEGGWRVRQELRPDGRRGRYSAWREMETKGTGLTKFLRTLSLREVFAPAQRAFAFNLVRILVQQTQDRLLLTPATSQAADTPDTSSDRTARPDNHQGRTVEMESPESKTGSLPSTPRTLTPSELGSEWSHYIRQGAPHGYPVRYPKKKREAADNQEPAAATEDQEMGGMDDVSSESWDEMNYLVMKPTGMTKQQVIEMNAAPAAKSPATTPFSAASSSAGPSAHQHGMTQDNLAAHTEQAPDPYGEGSLDRHVGGWLSGLAAGTPGPPPSMGEDEDVDMEDS